MVARLLVGVVLLALVAWPERHVQAVGWHGAFDPTGPAERGADPWRMGRGMYFTVDAPWDLAEDPSTRVYGSDGGRARGRERLRVICPDDPPDEIEVLVQRVLGHSRYYYRDADLDVVLDVLRDLIVG